MTDKHLTKLERATQLATEAHTGQWRKYTGEPYIVHPIAVAKLVAELGGDENQQVAGVLHDVVEDTDVTMEEVLAQFGEDVATLVDAVTKRKHLGETYFEFVARSIAAGPRVRIVKRADVTDNWRTLPAEDGLNDRYAKTIKMLDAADAAE